MPGKKLSTQEMANRFKRLLDGKNIKRKVVAQAAGLSHISGMETGIRPITAMVLKAISEIEELGPEAVNYILTGKKAEGDSTKLDVKDELLRMARFILNCEDAQASDFLRKFIIELHNSLILGDFDKIVDLKTSSILEK